ncbi:MAG: DUF1186 domain-containing protein [Polyangiaceae bacterium]|nr:DUF1186 domain-containing protein [Polyangiaceae bacterium]
MTTHPENCEPMSVTEILKELELCTGRFPKRAIEQAVEQREAVTPELLRVLEEVAADPGSFAQREDYMLHLFAMHLLAQFREKRAYRPIVTIFSAPGDVPDRLAGDTVTEGLKQILGSVYDGDPEPLHGLVEDPNVDEYVRSTAIHTFVVLWASGQMPREDVVSYYRSLFRGKLERRFSQAWNTLVVRALVDLRAHELLEEVRQAYADGLVEPFFARLEELESSLVGPARPLRGCDLITDTVSEMEWWACFGRTESKSKRTKSPAKLPRPISPIVVKALKVGRNDPCRCGSGKKYKKCCGSI